MSYPQSMAYDDLGVNSMEDYAQPSGPADDASSSSVGGTVSNITNGLNLQVKHGIFLIFFLALAIYSGAAYWFFRRINQAI
jgi:hypothetical protein